MRTFLYTGANRSQDLIRLTVGVASLRLPVFVASFGQSIQFHPVAPYAHVLPIEMVHIRLPGLGLPRGCTSADEVIVQAALAVLRQVIGQGDYQLVILDAVREAVAREILTVADLQRLVRAAPDDAEIAMT